MWLAVSPLLSDQVGEPGPLVQAEPGRAGVELRVAMLRESELEAEHIGEVLRLTAGNKSRAARILGISRQGLIEKLRRLRLETGLERQVH